MSLITRRFWKYDQKQTSNSENSNYEVIIPNYSSFFSFSLNFISHLSPLHHSILEKQTNKKLQTKLSSISLFLGRYSKKWRYEHKTNFGVAVNLFFHVTSTLHFMDKSRLGSHCYFLLHKNKNNRLIYFEKDSKKRPAT